MSFNFMAAIIIHSDFGPQENKVFRSLFSFPIYMPWSDGTRCMIFVFWMLSFKPAFSLSFLTFIKRFLSSSLLSIIRVVSSVYLKLLIFLLAILIPACPSSNPVHPTMMYSFPNFEPVYCFMSSSNCCFLTCIQVSLRPMDVVGVGGVVVKGWFVHDGRRACDRSHGGTGGRDPCSLSTFGWKDHFRKVTSFFCTAGLSSVRWGWHCGTVEFYNSEAWVISVTLNRETET